MGENPPWSDVEEIRQEFLEPVSQEIGKQLGASTQLVIEDEKTSTGRIHKSMRLIHGRLVDSRRRGE
jgi:hypothetical protein